MESLNAVLENLKFMKAVKKELISKKPADCEFF